MNGSLKRRLAGKVRSQYSNYISWLFIFELEKQNRREKKRQTERAIMKSRRSRLIYLNLSLLFSPLRSRYNFLFST